MVSARACGRVSEVFGQCLDKGLGMSLGKSKDLHKVNSRLLVMVKTRFLAGLRKGFGDGSSKRLVYGRAGQGSRQCFRKSLVKGLA